MQLLAPQMSIFGKFAVGPSVPQGYVRCGRPLCNAPLAAVCAFAKFQKKHRNNTSKLV